MAKYTTANSDTYELSDGRMLTQVFEHPINRRDAAGQWQPIGETSEASGASSMVQPEVSAGPDAERNPLGQENESACTLTSTAPTTSACNELTFKAGYETAGKSAQRGLIQFVLPDLHEELIVLNAQLELYAAKTTTSTGVAMGAYRVTTPWTTGATWDTTNGSTPWHTPGGDYANPEKESDAAFNSSVGAKTGWTYWYPTRMVQEWYDGTDAPSGQGQPDLGFLLKDVSEGATNNLVTFDGREERTRNPGLTLEWVQRGVGSATNYTQLPMQLSSTQSLSVNPASGNLMIHSTDLQIASKGLEFDSSRTWNSLANEAPDYGYGWIDSNARYVQVAASGNVAFTDSSGNTFPFIKEGSTFKTTSGIEATMCEAGSPSPCPSSLPSGTSYQLIYTSTGERIDFGHKESDGSYVYYYVVSVENSAGEKQTAKYTTGLEYPTSWLDTEKTEIAYTESEAKGYTKITAKTEPTRSTSYVEPLGEDGLYHLTEYTNEHKEKTIYRYGGESYLEGNLLTEITEPNGNVTKLTYNSDYQITKIIRTTNSEHTKGPTTTYTYYELGKAPAPCTSTQKATVVAETEGSEEPTLTYCSNVLDEVEQVYGYPQTGQPGWYALEEEPLSETEIASVNLDSGDLLVKGEDVQPEAADQNLPLDRYYNSQAMPAASTLSPKWRWGTGPSVYLVNQGATVIVHGPSGYAAVLKRTSNSTYSAPAEYEGTLTKNSNGTYTLVDEDNPTYQFNAAGVLTSETTEEGNTFTVNDETLSGKSVLHSLAPASGKALEVTYNGTPLVTQTTDPAGHIRKYEYNGSGQLAIYTAPSGAKTEYTYSNGYLSKIKTPEATETITTVSGRVSEISVTRSEETGTSSEKFSYGAPTAPTCNPASDVEETVVTHVPGEEKDSFCFNAHGENTTPQPAGEQNEIEGEGELPEISPEACAKEHPGTYCGEEEVPPESNEEEGKEGASRDALQPAGQVLVPGKDLAPSRYGISDNNRVTPREGHEGFDIFTNPFFEALNVVTVGRTIEWNLVYEAERGAIPNENEETKQRQKYAKGLLEDLEEWITGAEALDGGHGQPVITLDHCHEPGDWVNPEPAAKDALVPCDEPAGAPAYKIAIEAFLSHKLKNGQEIGHVVHRYSAWDEPDNKGLVPGSSEHVEPTYNKPKLAGEYWFELDELCRVDKYDCEVAAGDFLDSDLPDALHEKTLSHEPNPYYTYMKEYVSGMHYPRHANRWAWHAYEDGEKTQQGSYRGHPKKWWGRFKNFAEVVMKYDSGANIWLLEQGAVFTEPGKARIPRKDEGLADDIVSAFVKDGKYQLTRVDRQIKQFYYYQMRSEDKPNFETFDSGLLEEKPEHEGEKTYNERAPSTPRHIYSIYKAKTPKS